MTPFSNKIFVTPLEKPVTSLLIPPKYAYKSKGFLSGIVVSKGKKVIEVDDGDEVAYHKDSGKEVEIDGKKMVVIRPVDILAVL